MSSLDRKLRRLLERHCNMSVPADFAEPLTSFTVGAVIDISDPDLPTIGHLSRPPFEVEVPEPHPTGVLDIDLSLQRSLKVGGSGRVGSEAISTDVEVTANVRSARDVVVLLEPAAGSAIDDLLTLAASVARCEAWEHGRYAFVSRIFAAKSGEVSIAREGGGQVTVRGSSGAVSKAIKGEVSVGVTWEYRNLYTKSFVGTGVFGVQLVKVTKKGRPRML